MAEPVVHIGGNPLVRTDAFENQVVVFEIASLASAAPVGL